jgi:hypothetical protein
VVITRGFKDEPNLDLLEEARWRLRVDLDEEEWLDSTHLVASTFGGWVTVLQPPWFSDREQLVRWEILQARRDEDGEEIDMARKSLSVSEALEIAPARFHAWVIEITEEALETLDEAGPELEPTAPGQNFDDGATILAELSKLRTELGLARNRRNELQRRRERFYGDLYIYEFTTDTDLYWRIDTVDEDAEWLIVRDASDMDDRFARVLIPPDSLTEWRWASLDNPDAGGEYLTPAEVLAKAPVQFGGWIVAKTYEALQQVRHALFELGKRALVDTDDFARLARLSRHAQGLASLSQRTDVSYPGAPEIDEEDVVAGTRGPDGRAILLFEHSWSHILIGHPELEDHLDAVMKALEDPEHREPDPRVGRERLFRRGGPETWVRVVIEMAGPLDRVVTAFPQVNPPEGWRAM